MSPWDVTVLHLLKASEAKDVKGTSQAPRELLMQKAWPVVKGFVKVAICSG